MPTEIGTKTANATLRNIFSNTLQPNPVTKYTLFRGVTDYTNLAQFDLYETGYSFLILLEIPYFLDRLASTNGDYDDLIKNYRHIVEYEFRGANGIEDIQGETSPLQNGITDLNIITKVTEQGGSQFSMNYFERSGSVITKTHELFLRGIKDPKTQVKRYNGLLQSPLTLRNSSLSMSSDQTTSNLASMTDKGYQYEIFHFLLIVTDNTALNIEKCYILASCQPSVANTSIYNVTRGDIQFQELAVQYNGIPIPGRVVNKIGQEFLNKINQYTCFDEMDFGYSVVEKQWAGGIGNPDDAVRSGDAYGDIMNANSLAQSRIWNGTSFEDKNNWGTGMTGNAAVSSTSTISGS